MKKLNSHRPHRARVSNQSQYLTAAELRHARLALAQDMVELVLSDAGALPPPMQSGLEGVAKVLDTLMQDARRRG
jgi:hypothetical protein